MLAVSGLAMVVVFTFLVNDQTFIADCRHDGGAYRISPSSVGSIPAQRQGCSR